MEKILTRTFEIYTYVVIGVVFGIPTAVLLCGCQELRVKHFSGQQLIRGKINTEDK